MKYLYPYECDKLNLSVPDELQSAIDGNRREGRRTMGRGEGAFASPTPLQQQPARDDLTDSSDRLPSTGKATGVALTNGSNSVSSASRALLHHPSVNGSLINAGHSKSQRRSTGQHGTSASYRPHRSGITCLNRENCKI